ncbi:MAG: hypothetical protein RI936_308, partial [Pseudomonadota bacterium]
MHAISNIPFDEIELGRPLSVTRTLSKTDIEALAFASGDIDAFSDDEALQADTQRSTEAVGAECLIAHLINRRLPGPGSSILAQDFRFTSFLTVGDEVSATLLP